MRATRFLHRAVLSHLAVALPPALVLGWLVVAVNRDGLLAETHHTAIAVASRVKDALLFELESTRLMLGSAERILDATEIPLEARRELIRALVAEGRTHQLVVYNASAVREAVFDVEGAPPMPESLDETTRAELAEKTIAIGRLIEVNHRPSFVPIFMRWQRDGETFGYLASAIPLAPLSAIAKEQAELLLGPDGELDVVDADLNYLASSRGGRVGARAGPGTAFESVAGGAQKMAFTTIGAGAFKFTVLTGEKRFASLVAVPELKWMIGASRPEATALRSISLLQRRVYLLAILAALLGGLAGLALARTVSRPLEELARSVRNSIGRGLSGDLAAPRTREIGELVSAFNELARHLEARREETRSDSLIQLRLARFLSPENLRDLITHEREVHARAQPKDISVLYTDIRPGAIDESTPREKLVSLLGEFFAAACTAIEERGGRVDRYSGAAVIGVFTDGTASDRAKRAMRAAESILETARAIAERHGLDNNLVTAGVASGQGMLGLVGDAEVSVVGTLVESAATLQSGAAPGAIAADANTLAALEEGKQKS